MRKNFFSFILLLFFITGMIRADNVYLHIPDGSNDTLSWSIDDISVINFLPDDNYKLFHNDGSSLYTSSMEKSPLWLFSPDSIYTSIESVSMQDNQSLMVLYRDNNNIALHLEEAIEGLFTVRIYDMQGRVCYQNTHRDVNQIEISTQGLMQGVYQILLYVSDGSSYRSNYIKY